MNPSSYSTPRSPPYEESIQTTSTTKHFLEKVLPTYPLPALPDSHYKTHRHAWCFISLTVRREAIARLHFLCNMDSVSHSFTSTLRCCSRSVRARKMKPPLSPCRELFILSNISRESFIFFYYFLHEAWVAWSLQASFPHHKMGHIHSGNLLCPLVAGSPGWFRLSWGTSFWKFITFKIPYITSWLVICNTLSELEVQHIQGDLSGQ